MNFALGTYCILSGAILIYDWFKIRKLKKAETEAVIAARMAFALGEVTDQLMHEVVSVLAELEKDPEIAPKIAEIGRQYSLNVTTDDVREA